MKFQVHLNGRLKEEMARRVDDGCVKGQVVREALHRYFELGAKA